MFEYLKKGDVITAPITFSDLVGSKIRPMLVLHHDQDYDDDDDLRARINNVVPICLAI